MTCQRRSAYDVIELGYSPSQAKAWKRTAESFLGPADSPKVQRETVAAAEQAGLSIDRLTMINRHALRLKSRGQAWALRAELVAMTDSYKEVNAHAAARVEEILGPRPPEAGVRFGRAKHGKRTMSVTDSQRRIADLEKTLDTGIQKHIEAGGAADTGTAPTTMTRMRPPARVHAPPGSCALSQPKRARVFKHAP